MSAERETERRILGESITKALRMMARGTKASDAARACEILVGPHFNDYILSRQFAKDLTEAGQWNLEVELVPLAFAALRRCVQETAPFKVQLDAAKAILNRGGFPEQLARVDPVDGEAIEQMTREELHTFVKSAEAKLAELATQVDAAQTDDGTLQHTVNPE